MKKINNVPDKGEVYISADELYDAWTLGEDGLLTRGEPVMSTVVHERELWHEGILVLVYDAHGSVLLLQQRAEHALLGNKWDTSCAGHMRSGELQTDTIVREMYEELNIDLLQDDLEGVTLEHIATVEDEIPFENGKIHKEIQQIFLMRVNEQIKNTLKVTSQDVQQLAWMSKEKVEKSIQEDFSTNNAIHMSFVQRKKMWKILFNHLEAPKNEGVNTNKKYVENIDRELLLLGK